MAVSRTQPREWDDLADLDPLWAVLAEPGRRFGGWDRQAFLQRGAETIEATLAEGASYGVPAARRDALDFGCGAGRLTHALSAQFERCLGLDISQRMIEQARTMTHDRDNCSFALHRAPNLSSLASDSFDMVVSYLVLQHVTETGAKERYISEFVRVLRPEGLLAFHLPSTLAAWRLLQPGPRLYRMLRLAGVPRRVLYRGLHLHPIRMSALERDRVIELLNGAGARVLAVHERRVAAGVISNEYLATKDAARP